MWCNHPRREQNTTTKPSQKRPTRWGKIANAPKGEEATVEPRPQREHRPREGCVPQGGCRKEKRVSSGGQQRNRTTPAGIRHLGNPPEGGSDKGDAHGGLQNPSQRVSNTTPLVVGNTEHRSWVGLGRNNPCFNYRSPRTTYSGTIRNNTLLKKRALKTNNTNLKLKMAT